MKLTLKTLTVTLLLASTGAWSATITNKSGNGDSYSGPKLSGDAVVMSADKPIKRMELGEAMSACFQETKFFTSLLSPLVQGNAEARLIKKYFDASSEARIIYLGKADIDTSSLYESYEVSVDENGFNMNLIKGLFRDSRRKLNLKSFPKFKFGSTKIANSYDPITGDLEKNDIAYINLQIIYDTKNAPPYETAINLSTGKPTKLSAPVADFTTCLVDKVGRM